MRRQEQTRVWTPNQSGCLSGGECSPDFPWSSTRRATLCRIHSVDSRGTGRGFHALDPCVDKSTTELIVVKYPPRKELCVLNLYKGHGLMYQKLPLLFVYMHWLPLRRRQPLYRYMGCKQLNLYCPPSVHVWMFHLYLHQKIGFLIHFVSQCRPFEVDLADAYDYASAFSVATNKVDCKSTLSWLMF